MTPVALWLTALAAALGAGQCQSACPAPPACGTGCMTAPTAAPAPCCSRNASPCCQKTPVATYDCTALPACGDPDDACPRSCPGKQDKDESCEEAIPLSYTLDVLSDTLEFVCDLLSTLWPFNSSDADVAGMELPSPRYLDHPPQYCPPSPACATTPNYWQAPSMSAAPPVMMSTPAAPPVMLSTSAVQPAYPPGQSVYLNPAVYQAGPQVMYPAPNPPAGWAGPQVYPCPVQPQFLQVALPVPCAVPPLPPAVKATFKVVSQGEHHVLSITQGDSTLVCKKTTLVVGGHELVFAPGKERVHVHGKTFEASATKICTKENGALVLEGDVHVNCDDHGKATVFKGAKAVLELSEDGHVSVSTAETLGSNPTPKPVGRECPPSSLPQGFNSGIGISF